MDNVLDVVRDVSKTAQELESIVNDLLVHLCSSIFILDEFDIDDKY